MSAGYPIYWPCSTHLASKVWSQPFFKTDSARLPGPVSSSSRSGILKAEAVLLYVRALTEAGIKTFIDFDQDRRAYAEAMILGLPGQSSGIAFDYFMMLAGDDNLIKPDRMVQRYVENALKLDAIPQPRQAAILVRLAARDLCQRGHQWTPLSLDHAIWKHQSSQGGRPDRK